MRKIKTIIEIVAALVTILGAIGALQIVVNVNDPTPAQAVGKTPQAPSGSGSSFGGGSNNGSTAGSGGLPSQNAEPCAGLLLSAPAPGVSVMNPVRFQWIAVDGSFYQLFVEDDEPDREYSYQSGWLTGGSVDLSIPDSGIGNIRWFIVCTAKVDSGRYFQSPINYFVYDPHYLQKTRQAQASP